MIISKYGKSYDTADGSEQSAQGSTSAYTDGQAAKERWDDDGGPSNDQAPMIVKGATSKPAWSVLSLRDLNDAIRRGQRPDDKWRLRQEAAQIEREKDRRIKARDRGRAGADRARRDLHRNPGEHT